MKTGNGRPNRQNSLKKAAPPPRAAAAGAGGGLHPAIPWIALGLLALAVYAPALGAGFIWDDEALTANPFVTSPGGLWKIWLLPRQMAQEQHYWPLVYSTFWLEHLLAGLNPLIYHLNNILLHAAVSVLLWRVLAALAVPGAWLGAALFAVHPVHAESVAWIIERKDVLSGAFTMGAALAYLRFHEHRLKAELPNSAIRNPQSAMKWYWLALGLFTAAMLSKSMAVGLPLALGLVIWWRSGRLTRRDLRALAPLAAIAVALTLADIYFYRGQQLAGFENSGLALPERVLMAGGSLWLYLFKLVCPWPLATFYPKWKVALDYAPAWIPLAGWVGMLAGLWFARRRIGRGPFAAMAFFSLTLAPALGVIDFDFLAYSWIADRFQYLASAGPLVLAAAGLTALARQYQWPADTARWCAAALLGVLGLLCVRQAALYRDSETLFRAAVARAPQCWAAHTNLATVLTQSGRPEEAIQVLREGLRATARPDGQLTLDLAIALAGRGQFPEAEQYYKKTLELKPGFAEGLIHYGAFLVDRRRLDEAVIQYRAALAVSPDNAMALCNLGNILRQQDKLEEAEERLRRAVELAPEFAGYRVNLAQVLADRKKIPEAIEQCLRALQLDPNDLDGQFTLGQILLNRGNFQEAIAHLEQADRLQPQTPEILFFLGQTHEGLKDRAGAIRYYQEVLRLRPEHAEAARRLYGLNAPPTRRPPPR